MELDPCSPLRLLGLYVVCTAVLRIQECRHLEQFRQIKVLHSKRREHQSIDTASHPRQEPSDLRYLSSEKSTCLGSKVGRPACSLVSAVHQSKPTCQSACTAILQQIHEIPLTNHFMPLSSDVNHCQHRRTRC